MNQTRKISKLHILTCEENIIILTPYKNEGKKFYFGIDNPIVGEIKNVEVYYKSTIGCFKYI